MDVRHSLYTERSVVRTWLLRGTLHLAAAEDVRWLLALLGPRFVAAGWRRRLQLGLDDAKCARGLEAIRAILAAQGPLTRAELVEGLASRGVALDPKGQDRAHLVGLAALQGILCLGPGGKDDDTTYALLDDWIPPGRPLQREAALAELARRYLGAYAPAGPEDLAAWAGLAVSEARRSMRLIAAELVEVDVAGAPAWMLAGAIQEPPPPGRATVRLLPTFDTYLLGYRSRRLMMAPAIEARIQRGGGWLHPTVAVDGWVVGTWKLARPKREVEVAVELFEPISSQVQAGIDGEVSDIRRFVGVAEGDSEPVG